MLSSPRVQKLDKKEEERLAKSIVIIGTGTRLSTGFRVYNKDLIITNYHSIKHLYFKNSFNPYYKVDVLLEPETNSRWIQAEVIVASP